MLKKFSVRNFKNFKETFTLDFSDVHDYQFNKQCIKNGILNKTIIYGKNSVGKTNLGIALFDITSHLVDTNGANSMYQYYLNGDSDEKYATFRYEFEFDGETVVYEYKKISKDTLVEEELEFNDTKIFKYDFINKVEDFSGLKYLNIDSLNWQFKNEKMSIVKYIANNTILDDSSPVLKIVRFVSKMLWFRSLELTKYISTNVVATPILQYIIENKYVSDFESFLNKCGVKEKICVKTEATGQPVLYFKHKRMVPFIRSASSGTISLTALYYWMKQLEDVSFLWIDEFDAFYHFELAEKVVLLLEEYLNCQIVLTSHNTNLLSNRIMRPDCYFVLSKKRITSLCNATERELREGHNLEKMYQAGEFGE